MYELDYHFLSKYSFMDAILSAVVSVRGEPGKRGIQTDNFILQDRAQGLAVVVLRRKDVLESKAKSLESQAPDALGAPDPADQLVMTPHNRLVLIKNRFNIMDVHLLLCAAEFVHQLQPLELSDMEVIQPLLEHGVLAAYNAGRLSGASQPRKHIQLIGLPFFSDPQWNIFPLSTLVDNELSDPSKYDKPTQLSVFKGRCHGVIRFTELKSPKELYAHYIDLLEYCSADELIAVNRHDLGLGFDRPPPGATEGVSVDYLIHIYRYDFSLLITNKFMFIGVRETDRPLGVGCNSISYTGNIFVGSDDQEHTVTEIGPFAVLAAGLKEFPRKKNVCHSVHSVSGFA